MSILSPPPSTLPPPSHHHSHPLLPFLAHCHGMPQLKQIHAKALRTSSSSSAAADLHFLFSRLLEFSASAADLDYASRLLHHPLLPINPNSFCWNALIRAYARSPPRTLSALHLFRRMLADPAAPTPDRHTFPFVLKACAFLSASPEGEQVHSLLLRLGFAADTYCANSLVHFYASCSRLPPARRLFDRIRHRTRVSWNVIIDGYVAGGEHAAALALFRAMQAEFAPDAYTLQSALGACGGLGALSLAMWAHALMLRRMRDGDDSPLRDVLVNNSLVDVYARCGAIRMAHQVFEGMRVRDKASWNAMILGFAMHGRVAESLKAFDRMWAVDKLAPDSITFVGVLSACNHGGLVAEGKKYFSMMVNEFGIEARLEHYGCMVDLLARSGLIEEALDLVTRMPCRPDAVIWRSLLDSCCKRNASIEVSESVAKQVIESEEKVTSGVFVLLSKIYASANRWDNVGIVRQLMTEKGIYKEPGCSSIELHGEVHEFIAGDTSHPRSAEIYEKLKEVEVRVTSVGYMPDSSEAAMVAEGVSVKSDALRLHSERLVIAFGLLDGAPGVPIRVLKNLRMCRDCHIITKLISRVYGVEIFVRDRVRFHHFKDGLCSCSDYW